MGQVFAGCVKSMFLRHEVLKRLQTGVFFHRAALQACGLGYDVGADSIISEITHG